MISLTAPLAVRTTRREIAPVLHEAPFITIATMSLVALPAIRTTSRENALGVQYCPKSLCHVRWWRSSGFRQKGLQLTKWGPTCIHLERMCMTANKGPLYPWPCLSGQLALRHVNWKVSARSLWRHAEIQQRARTVRIIVKCSNDIVRLFRLNWTPK